jgi:hypothetical protein
MTPKKNSDVDSEALEANQPDRSTADVSVAPEEPSAAKANATRAAKSKALLVAEEALANTAPAIATEDAAPASRRRKPRVAETESTLEVTTDPEGPSEIQKEAQEQSSDNSGSVAETELDDERQEVKPTKKGWLKRLFSLFGRKGNGAQDLSEDSIETMPQEATPTEESILTESELSLSPNQLRKLLTATRKEHKEEVNAANLAEAEMHSSLDASEKFAISLQDLTEQQDAINRSYLGQVKTRMSAELEKAKEDLVTHRSNIESLQILDQDTLLTLRKQFHKSFGTVSKHVLFWVVLVTMFANIKSLPNLAFFRNIYDHNTSGPVIIAITVLVIGLSSIVRRYLKLAKLSARAYAKFVLWVSLIGAFLYFLPLISPWIDQNISPFLRYHFWEIMSGLLSFWVISLFLILARYYSGWSEFRRAVQLQVHQLRGVIEGYVKTQQEIARLNILHRQVMDWMELIASAVYKPWQVNPDWGSKNEYSAHFETFPFALRVAQAQEGSSVNMAALENDIARSLLVPGWREDAFEDLIQNIAQSMGLDPTKFNTELLDHDLPHQSNNSRELIKRFFGEGDKMKQESIRPVLTEVAKRRLLTLVNTTQSQLVSTSRPRVEQILDDPLASLRDDPLGIEPYDPSESWDDFLRESLGTDSIEQVPLGPLNFNLKGRMAGATGRLKTFIVAPKRFQESLPAIADPEHVELVSIGDDKPRSVEILARIDISDQVPFDHLTVMGRTPENYSTEPLNSEPKREIL